jgi:uncharacterized protein (TIGR03435 family)
MHRRNVLLGATIFLLGTVPGCAQMQNGGAQDAAKAPEFDVATVKPVDAGTVISMVGVMQSQDGVDAQNVTVAMLIQFAYGQKIYRMEDQVVGLPEWAKTQRYNVRAKMNEADASGMQKLSGDERQKQLGLRMQALLAERFGLKLHRGTKQGPDYELVVAKGGPKIKPVGDDDPGIIKGKDGQLVKGGMISFMNGTFTAQQTTLGALASMLSQSQDVGRPVLDKTGLTGKYNFTLNWSPTLSLPGGLKMPAQNEDAASVFTALEDDLGLKLVSSTGTQETLVVEQVSRPSAD